MADSLVIVQMMQFKRDLLNREGEQMEQMARRWEELEEALRPAIDVLTHQLTEARSAGTPITQSQLFRLRRYQALVSQIEAEWGKYQRFAVDVIEAGQREWGNAGITHAARSIRTMAPMLTINMTVLPVNAIENLVGLMADGSPLSSWLMDNAVQAEAIDKLTGALLRGVGLGQNPRKTAQMMQDGLLGGLNQALNTARTEQMRVYREANRQQMEASGVVDGYYRLATRDDRTCPACLMRDGEFYPLGTVMPEHNQGRCAQVPAVRGFNQPQWERGRDWFMKRSPEQQRKQLGNARYEAWQRGEFNLSELATVERNGVWGNQLRTASAQDLVN